MQRSPSARPCATLQLSDEDLDLLIVTIDIRKARVSAPAIEPLPAEMVRACIAQLDELRARLEQKLDELWRLYCSACTAPLDPLGECRADGCPRLRFERAPPKNEI